jgi:uncharacterized protein
MKITLYGGFGEKGRTCIGVEAGVRLLLDAGINTSADGRDWYPAISPEALRRLDAVVVTHGHEDHVAALGWCVEHGFRGPAWMTPETRNEMRSAVADYGGPSQLRLLDSLTIEPFSPGDRIRIGPATVTSGRSGHAVGGVWLAVEHGGKTLVHCGDVVPASAVLPFDPLPPCDAILLDAAYGDDDVPASARARAVVAWVEGNGACVLPTPASGRSLELLAILPMPLALAESMVEPVRYQLSQERWLRPALVPTLAARLAAAQLWREGEPLPDRPLLVHDGMGLAGPSRRAVEEAHRLGRPMLFTGHLPTGSPGERLVSEGAAAWLRLPTHPTLSENVAMVRATGARLALGHSCDGATQARLAPHLPGVLRPALTGETFAL